MNKYVGIPYRRDGRDKTGADCWGLLTIIYRDELGISLPDYKGLLTGCKNEFLEDFARYFHEEKKRWIQVNEPQRFDLALIRAGEFHVGIIAGKGTMLHTMNKIESVIESYTGMEWKHRIRGFFRHE